MDRLDHIDFGGDEPAEDPGRDAGTCLLVAVALVAFVVVLAASVFAPR